MNRRERSTGRSSRLGEPALQLVSAMLIALVPTLVFGAAEPSQTDLTTVSELLEREQPQEALKILDRRIKKNPKDVDARVLRSSARFMIGDLAGGRDDLNRALELAPENRRAWINLAALELAEENFPAALEAFQRIERLDPDAAENSLNIGAVLLLMNRFGDAQTRFRDYLARHPRDPQARYLVASNYAMRGFTDPAIANLRRSIALDEKMRSKARTDPNFAPLEKASAYQELLNTDSFRHAPGSRISSETYNAPYLAGQSVVLDAVISSLQLAGQPFDPRVEVATSWALIWSELRIKVADDGHGETVLELSAPPGRFDADAWRRVTTELLRGVTVQLHIRKRRSSDSNR